MRLEALALRHVDGGQHLVDRPCENPRLYPSRAALYCSGSWSPRSSSAWRPKRLEGVAPPVEVQVQVHVRMLVHTEDVKPDYDVRAEVVPQRIYHNEKLILPNM